MTIEFRLHWDFAARVGIVSGVGSLVLGVVLWVLRQSLTPTVLEIFSHGCLWLALRSYAVERGREFLGEP